MATFAFPKPPLPTTGGSSLPDLSLRGIVGQTPSFPHLPDKRKGKMKSKEELLQYLIRVKIEPLVLSYGIYPFSPVN